MLKKYHTLKKQDLSWDLARIDNIIEILESERDLSRIIVHVDMDAFYASVEERDNPNLKGKPMAVGDNSMLSTANYEARKVKKKKLRFFDSLQFSILLDCLNILFNTLIFLMPLLYVILKYGVRSAMPGFIARKLCPHLILVPLHFDKYRAVSKRVREIFARYDPNFTPMSLDEAYLDITEYLRNNNNNNDNENNDNNNDNNDNGNNNDVDKSADKVVQQIREEIFKETKLTASAGIAANKLLAKVFSHSFTYSRSIFHFTHFTI